MKDRYFETIRDTWFDNEDPGIKYIVKPEEKIVIGIYTRRSDDYLLNRMSSYSNVVKNIFELALLDHESESEIKAVAKCHEDDEFNEEFGKKLVEAKINKKRHQRLLRQLDVACKDLCSCMEAYHDLCREHTKKIVSINNDLKNYFKVEED